MPFVKKVERAVVGKISLQKHSWHEKFRGKKIRFLLFNMRSCARLLITETDFQSSLRASIHINILPSMKEEMTNFVCNGESLTIWMVSSIDANNRLTTVILSEQKT